MPAKSFFDLYAQEYDFLTDAPSREVGHRKEVERLIEQFKPRSVLDAGCATGLTSRLFAELGVNTVGLDRSRKMIDFARDRNRDLSLPLKFQLGHFERLPKQFDGRFDLIVCLANAIAGLDTLSNLKTACRKFWRALSPGGVLVIQALNLASLRDGETFPIKVTRNEGIVYVRFARRSGNLFELNVVRLDLDSQPIKQEPFTHVFDNFSVSEVQRAVSQAGFGQIQRFGNLLMTKRFGVKSRDLVLIAHRSGN